MKTMGLIRRIDDLGRIVIPKEYRQRLKIEIGQPFEIVVIDGLIVLGKVEESECETE